MPETGKLAKAYLAISKPSTDGTATGGGQKIEFAFNPKELTIERVAEWKAKTSKKPSMPEFVGTKPAGMTLEMFLDGSEGADITATVKQLMECVDPHPATKSAKPSPPFVTFGWGSFPYIDHAVIKSVSVKFTRFKADGTPIRAIATIKIEELKPAAKGQNPTSGSLDAKAEHVVGQGDSLASISYRHLGTADAWRLIAEANSIDDPFRVPPGTRLVIPAPGGPVPTN